MKIWLTSGEPCESRDRNYTAAEAAAIVRDWEWAAVDNAGDVIVGEYRTRAAWSGGQPVSGAKLAARLSRATTQTKEQDQ
jgi:hypothetical protein